MRARSRCSPLVFLAGIRCGARRRRAPGMLIDDPALDALALASGRVPGRLRSTACLATCARRAALPRCERLGSRGSSSVPARARLRGGSACARPRARLAGQLALYGEDAFRTGGRTRVPAATVRRRRARLRGLGARAASRRRSGRPRVELGALPRGVALTAVLVGAGARRALLRRDPSGASRSPPAPRPASSTCAPRPGTRPRGPPRRRPRARRGSSPAMSAYCLTNRGRRPS